MQQRSCAQEIHIEDYDCCLLALLTEQSERAGSHGGGTSTSEHALGDKQNIKFR